MALRQVILTVLSQGDSSGYEIVRQFDTVLSYFWKATHQQVYRELAKLLADDCVSMEEFEQAGKPNKKVYHLTRTGKKELKEWMLAPTAQEPPKLDLLVKLLAAPVVGSKAMRGIFVRNRELTESVVKQFREMEKVCLAVPKAQRSENHDLFFLVLRRGLLLTAAHLEWLQEVDAHLAKQKE